MKELLRQAQMQENLELGSNQLLQQECDSFNVSIGHLDSVDCEDCKNKGYIAVIDDGYVMRRECKCMAIRKSLKRIERSGLSSQLDKCTFDKYDDKGEWQKKIKATAQRYVRECLGNWFYIGGQVGSGKTHICTAIVGEFLKIGNEAKYMLWIDDATPLKAGIMDDDYQFNINKYKKVKVLYIDDFFKTEMGKNPSQADIKLAFEILNHRYNNPNLITIISSEKTIDELLDIDQAIGSRIYEKSRDHNININKDRSKNYRLKRAN